MPTQVKVLQRTTSTCTTRSINSDRNFEFYSKQYHDPIRLTMTESDAYTSVQEETQPLEGQQVELSQYRFITSTHAKPKWMSNKSLLESFRKVESPFVNSLLVLVINNIERECSLLVDDNEFWRDIYSRDKSDTAVAREIVHASLVEKKTIDQIRDLVDSQPLSVQTGIIRELLSILPKKLLFFNRKQIEQLSKKSLYDFMLRANPKIVKKAKEIVLRMSRTDINTIAFIMIHIFHLWEFSKSPHITKVAIADTYGPWIIEFEEKPAISCVAGANSSEGLILMALMDATDAVFWGNLTMMEVGRLFEYSTPFERKRIQNKRATVCLVGVNDMSKKFGRPSRILTQFSFRCETDESCSWRNMFISDKYRAESPSISDISFSSSRSTKSRSSTSSNFKKSSLKFTEPQPTYEFTTYDITSVLNKSRELHQQHDPHISSEGKKCLLPRLTWNY